MWVIKGIHGTLMINILFESEAAAQRYAKDTWTDHTITRFRYEYVPTWERIQKEMADQGPKSV